MTVSNSTFYGVPIINSVYESTLTLRNTIVANSSTGSNCTGDITDGGGNLSFPDSTCPGINSDPMLGPLQNNGGPTETMAPGSGSPAIDAGDDADPALRRRSTTRSARNCPLLASPLRHRRCGTRAADIHEKMVPHHAHSLALPLVIAPPRNQAHWQQSDRPRPRGPPHPFTRSWARTVTLVTSGGMTMPLWLRVKGCSVSWGCKQQTGEGVGGVRLGNRAIGQHHIPAVGVVVPAGVGVAYGDVEGPRFIGVTHSAHELHVGVGGVGYIGR